MSQNGDIMDHKNVLIVIVSATNVVVLVVSTDMYRNLSRKQSYGTSRG